MGATLPQIQNASPTLTAESVSLWTTFFRSLPEYKLYAPIYNEQLAAKFVEASGTIQGRHLNALMDLITGLGSDDADIRGDDEAMWYSIEKNRLAYIREAFGVLFDDISAIVATSGSTYDPANGTYGSGVAVGQRPSYCPRCGRGYGSAYFGHTSLNRCGYCNY